MIPDAALPPRAPAAHAPLTSIAVIIPAHDEQRLLGDCLDAVAAAAWRACRGGLRVETIVVADACTDETRAIARARDAVALTANGHNVGAARAAGTAHALRSVRGGGRTAAELYLLHTDADTLVPHDWITRHVEAAAGHDAVLGAVEIADWTPRGEDCARRYRSACAREPDRHRVHGANLGVRADAYLRVGGFPALSVAEDRTLVDALRTAGESVVFRSDLVVSTSARISRRVRGGFSDYLSGLDPRADRPDGPERG